MLELAFIQQCADPGVEIAIVERFISEAGTDNPLAVSITSGNRVILPEAPTTPDDALRLIDRFLGRAIVRVGITQYPAGHGMTDASELSDDLVDACGNIRIGSALFGKVYRIVVHALGHTGDETFAEAITAWRTGLFEGRYVFGEDDPGPARSMDDLSNSSGSQTEVTRSDVGISSDPESNTDFRGLDPNKADIRVNIPESLGGGN